MVFSFNSNIYDAELDSTYREIIITATSLDEACKIITAVSGMTSYTLGLESYTNMVVRRSAIVLENDKITVKITLREQTELEKAQSEISEMRTAIQEISESISEKDAANHPILFPDISKVDKVIPGNYYVINGVVQLVTGVVEDEAEPQIVSRPAKGGK